jgi:hypothetical protein
MMSIVVESDDWKDVMKIMIYLKRSVDDLVTGCKLYHKANRTVQGLVIDEIVKDSAVIISWLFVALESDSYSCDDKLAVTNVVKNLFMYYKMMGRRSRLKLRRHHFVTL